MADVFDSEKRSEVMSRIRSTGSKPELRLHEIVRTALGHRWRIDRNRRDLPGRPDVVIPTLKVAVFMDGCFFHVCPEHGRIPDANRDYWKPKLEGNVRRDRQSREQLRSDGWLVWRVWEHSLKSSSSLEETAQVLHAKLSREVSNWREQN